MMAQLSKKRLYKFLFLAAILVMLFTPLYMYFSDDVASLTKNYPHITIKNKLDAEYDIKPGRPRHWVNLNQISTFMKWSIIFSEDWAFYQHDGVDVEQMKVAVDDMMAGERFRGASTITQQMVKNIFLSESRTPWRKLHEIILAKKVEKVLSKQRILEVYLNSIEFGPGIYGIKNASYHYFGVHPSALTPRQSAFITMLLPSPKKYYVSFRKKTLTKFASRRVAAILKKMKMGKVISEERYEEELASRFSWEK